MDGRTPWIHIGYHRMLSAHNHQMGVSENCVTPKNGWSIMENPLKMDDLGVPLFSETSKSIPNDFSIWSRARTWWLLLLSCCWVAKTPLSKIILHLPKYWMNINVENLKNHCRFIVNGFPKKKCGQNASSRFIAMR